MNETKTKEISIDPELILDASKIVSTDLKAESIIFPVKPSFVNVVDVEIVQLRENAKMPTYEHG